MGSVLAFTKLSWIVIIILVCIWIAWFVIIVKLFWLLWENSIKNAMKNALAEHESDKNIIPKE